MPVILWDLLVPVKSVETRVICRNLTLAWAPLTYFALGWQYQGQVALTNQTGSDTWKIVAHPAKGQCEIMLPPYKNAAAGPFLFNLAHDETESHDLCASNPAQCDAMKQLMASYLAGIEASAKYESTCSVPP